LVREVSCCPRWKEPERFLLVSHADHSEHSEQVIITDQGIADLRGKSPHERATRLISHQPATAFRDECL
jgi:acyl-CoA hydrolase